MKNKYLLTKDYAKIYIKSKKHGLKVMLVSLEDFKTLNDKTKNMTIYLSVYPTNIYAVYEKNNKSISIHRDIMNTPEGLHTDYINGNGLDNRRENLRIVTRVVNNQNRKLSKNNKSKYNGITWKKLNKKWSVEISVDGKSKYIGIFDTLQDAVKVRKLAEHFYWEHKPKMNQVRALFNE